MVLIAAVESNVRSYRVSRVRGATITDQPFARPADFDLEELTKSIAFFLKQIGSHQPFAFDKNWSPFLKQIMLF